MLVVSDQGNLADSSPQLSVMMTLGRYMFATPEDEYECPCRSGKSVSTTGVLDTNVLCTSCGHLLSSHSKSVGQYGLYFITRVVL